MVEGKLAVEGNIVIVVEGGVVNTVYYNGEVQEATIIDHDSDGTGNLCYVQGEEVVVSGIMTETLPKALAEELGCVHLLSSKAEVLAKHKQYDIVRYYANAEFGENEKPMYGDIFSTRAELKNKHPFSPILEGYGVVDPSTGYHLDGAPDWFHTIADVIYYIDELEGIMKYTKVLI
ncbi:hypothetical protein ABD91_20705 [Lysinibacillus sphaericus]|uniref:hypothetical protein n=1 Tax=Lysinibacillus sphaericus TaxID=1421 RepID=UPI0018CC94C7|nr:hypothetical protein [Lysinibacillus sphaericus]MBG9693164.1 hypothetical protein [Lysinibacillus sphaericus]